MRPAGRRPGRDLLGIFARHPTAANLLMVLMIIAGVVSLTRMHTQFFPDFSIDWVTVNVEWPGASAEDVDSNIVAAIEPELRFLDDVKRVSSQSVEGVGMLAIEFDAGTDMQSALSNVETAVGQVVSLPDQSERPVIQRIKRYEMIGRLVVSGPYPEAALKAFAKSIREELLARGIDKVDLFGARDEEIRVEVRPEMLRQLGLEPDDIAARIGQSSLDLPSGTLPSGTEKQIRSLGLAKTVESIGHIEVRAREGGENIYLRDIARVTDAFDEDDPVGLRHGNPAIELQVMRAAESDALELAGLLEGYVAELLPTLPPNLKVELYNFVAALITDRINLLLRNGVGGLVLVVIVLFIFLSARVAFWVAVGIPVSLLATLGVMLLTGQSINMVSLFALIMAIGIIVDDAIVVGEHAVTRRAANDAPLQAAETGAKRMFAPVMSASLTTIAAFSPLFLVSGIIGKIVEAIPMVIVAILIASLIECFLVLPRHLRGALRSDPQQENRFARWFNPRFAAFRDGPFDRFLRVCIGWRYLTLSLAAALLIGVFGLIAGGRLDFVFFPSPESDSVYANITFPEGTRRETTVAMVGELERSLGAAVDELTEGEGGLVMMSFGQIGRPVGRADGFFLGSGDHLGGLRVELAPSDERTVRTQELIAAWRRHTRLMAGIDKLIIIEEQSGPPGREIDIRLSGHTLDDLKAASVELRELLARFPGVSDIDDSLPYGKQETILEVTSRGRALGFATEQVGRQVRGAFEGVIAKRFARGDEEVAVRVRYPLESLGEADLRRLYLLSPAGAEVPLSEVVDFREQTGFARIRREDGLRTASVTAEIDEHLTTSEKVLAAVREDGLRGITERYGVRVSFKGKAEEQATTMGDMKIGALVGLAAIYIILAWVFASYARPFVVMAVIPFGAVGAILGHFVLGFDLTVLTVVALLGLSGIVVNDSIILLRTIQGRLTAGEPLVEAVVRGTRDRLRAVILTSVTTIFGLLPLLFETSLQAQFLKPMAVTIVFGLLGTTLIVLVLVPTLLTIQMDIGALIRGRARREAPPPEPAPI